MQSLHLSDLDCILRWQQVGREGPVTLWLPGLGMPGTGNFLDVTQSADMPPTRAILLDFPGTGLSESPLPPLETLADHADCAAAVLDHLKVETVSVVGYSFGGSVAIELASRRPDLVTRLVVAEPNLQPGGGIAARSVTSVDPATFASELLPSKLAEFRRDAIAGNPMRNFLSAAWGIADPGALHGAARALIDLPADLDRRFRALTIPRTFVVGSKSLPAADEAARADATSPDSLRRDGIDVAVMNGLGHELILADPNGFARIVARALAA